MNILFGLGLVILGVIIGMFLLALISVNRINELEEALNTQIMLRKNRDKYITSENIQASKYREIVNIMANSNKTKENFFTTLEKIKEVIYRRQSTNNFKI